MPDLGAYAVEVGLAYLGSLSALIALVGVSFWQSKRANVALEDAETRSDNG